MSRWLRQRASHAQALAEWIDCGSVRLHVTNLKEIFDGLP